MGSARRAAYDAYMARFRLNAVRGVRARACAVAAACCETVQFMHGCVLRAHTTPLLLASRHALRAVQVRRKNVDEAVARAAEPGGMKKARRSAASLAGCERTG
jgi:hypothetical protein